MIVSLSKQSIIIYLIDVTHDAVKDKNSSWKIVFLLLYIFWNNSSRVETKNLKGGVAEADL